MEEHQVTLTMTGMSVLPREVLEDMTFRAQEALVESARDFALGAVAAANFAENAVEVDFVVIVASAAEAHEHVASVIRVLEGAGLATVRSAPEPLPSERFALSSSATHAVPQPVCA
ncbi:MAG TPA: hypothetical protein VFU94_12095 [Conexibacter sp.]|nr:hypothetical protein [Conexibacter sp.]